MHLSDNPSLVDLKLDDVTSISAVNPKDGYAGLGFILSYSSDIYSLIVFNLNKKKFNVAKFYSWLQMNESTPFLLKLRVLYGCMFEAMIYSSEAWGGNIDRIADSLLEIERKALKSCLGIKQGTSNDIIYVETKKADIVSTIKQRQYNFYQKFKRLSEYEAVAKKIWISYENWHDYSNTKPYICYYNSISDNAAQRKAIIQSSDKSMDIRYRMLFDLKYNAVLYDSMVNDIDRIVITRWRLSSHSLYVETGRYKRPMVNRENRKCKICNLLEDEYHALFICKAHFIIRIEFHDLLVKYTSLSNILNPSCTDDVKLIADYIRSIESNMKRLKMFQ